MTNFFPILQEGMTAKEKRRANQNYILSLTSTWKNWWSN
jgi:hypothetical protein